MRPTLIRSWVPVSPRALHLARPAIAVLLIAIVHLLIAATALAEGIDIDLRSPDLESLEAAREIPRSPKHSESSDEPASEPAENSHDEVTGDVSISGELITPDKIFNPAANRSAIRKIDGAGDDRNEHVQTETEPEEPLSVAALTWLMRVDGFGITDWEFGSADHRPHFIDHTRLHIDLPFAIHFIDEVQALGLPSELFSAQINTRLIQPINDVWGFDVAVTPGFFSDFDSGKNNGFRVTGHGIATYYHSDEWQFAFGAMYLGREDVQVLPAGGVVWNLSEASKIELLMPKPRVAQRVRADENSEQWMYTAFELFGGNSWEITRPDDSYDTFTYRDFRFLLGFENRMHHICSGVFEIGYVFARKLEFKRDPTILEPGGTLLLRCGSAY